MGEDVWRRTSAQRLGDIAVCSQGNGTGTDIQAAGVDGGAGQKQQGLESVLDPIRMTQMHRTEKHLSKLGKPPFSVFAPRAMVAKLQTGKTTIIILKVLIIRKLRIV